MNRQNVINDIKETLGKVPGFINTMPDDTLEQEWGLFKRFELQETSLPPKYRALMGVTASAVLHCWYCSNFHKAMAQMHGANEKEILAFISFSNWGGIVWSAYNHLYF